MIFKLHVNIKFMSLFTLTLQVYIGLICSLSLSFNYFCQVAVLLMLPCCINFFLWKKYEFTGIIFFLPNSFCLHFSTGKSNCWFTIQYCISPWCFKLTGHILSQAIYFNQTKLLAIAG